MSGDLTGMTRMVSIARREMRLAKTPADFMAARGLLARALRGERVFHVWVDETGEIKWRAL